MWTWWSYGKNLHIQIFLKLVEIVLWTMYFHKTIQKLGFNRFVFKLGAPHYRHFIQTTSILEEFGEAIEKKLHIQTFPKLVEIVLRTICFQKTIKKLGVNRFVFKLGGATLPTFNTEHFNIGRSWQGYRKNLQIQIFLKLVEIVLWTICFHQTI